MRVKYGVIWDEERIGVIHTVTKSLLYINPVVKRSLSREFSVPRLIEDLGILGIFQREFLLHFPYHLC